MTSEAGVCSSDEWNAISEEEREEMGLSFENDGEFWMCYDDFIVRKNKSKREPKKLSFQNELIVLVVE